MLAALVFPRCLSLLPSRFSSSPARLLSSSPEPLFGILPSSPLRHPRPSSCYTDFQIAGFAVVGPLRDLVLQIWVMAAAMFCSSCLTVFLLLTAGLGPSLTWHEQCRKHQYLPRGLMPPLARLVSQWFRVLKNSLRLVLSKYG